MDKPTPNPFPLVSLQIVKLNYVCHTSVFSNLILLSLPPHESAKTNPESVSPLYFEFLLISVHQFYWNKPRPLPHNLTLAYKLLPTSSNLFQVGACAHYVIVSKFQWKPVWLATRRDPQNDKGVPQGSVLGPLLFNIYVADLPSLTREHGAKMPSFADDMTLYCSYTSAALACSTVSAALKDTSRALALRGLSINVSKTVAMVIAPHSRACQGLPTSVRLLLQNEEVKLVSQTRLLGIIIVDSLSWSPHVDSICKKVGRKIGALRRTYRQLTPTARRQFSSQPDLEYAASATIPFMPTGQQDRLLALWQKAVRCLAGVHPQDDVLPLIRNLKLTLLSHRWSLHPPVHHNPTLSPTVCSGVTPWET